MIELGQAYFDNNNKVVIAPGNFECIININGTSLVLDGSRCNRGGRPEVIFYSFIFQTWNGDQKSSASMTMIAGNTAAGKLVLPHFQFQNHVQCVERQNVNINMVHFLHNIIGKFGAEKKRSGL